MADADKLALGLDDIIRINRSGNQRSGGGGGANRGGSRSRPGRGGINTFRNRGGGGFPRGLNSGGIGRWKHDLYDDNTNTNREGQRNSGVSSTTKLLISNLDFGVTTDDIQELFGDVGAIRTAHVHYDENGRSLGTAEVVFERRVDGVSAQKKYNGLNLDGRPMDITLVGTIDNGNRPQRNRFLLPNVGGNNRNQRGSARNNQQNSVQEKRIRSGNQPQNGTSENKITAEDLDAELDAYLAEAKQKK